jgi:hypothetical protein
MHHLQQVSSQWQCMVEYIGTDRTDFKCNFPKLNYSKYKQIQYLFLTHYEDSKKKKSQLKTQPISWKECAIKQALTSIHFDQLKHAKFNIRLK